MKQELQKASEIAKKVRQHALDIIKPNMKLLDLAEQIEKKIIDLGAKPAFPTNLGINDIAAHYTPAYNDETVANDLLKVDFGVSVEGYIVDVAFSLDFSHDQRYSDLIKASENALNDAPEGTVAVTGDEAE